MKRIRIFDNLFANTKSASLGGDNKDEAPKHVEWIREGPTQPVSWFTDGHIKDVAKYAPKKAIAWLLEPRCLHPEDYEAVLENEDFFDTILTHDPQLLGASKKARYYPYGGSWIHPDKWGFQEKTKDISMIINMNKNTTEGHKLRHEILERYGDQIDVFGYGINEVESKFEALAPYRFSIVIESCRSAGYFTEKLVDCISVGTVPLYWGCVDLVDYFDGFGVFYLSSYPRSELRKFISSYINIELFYKARMINIEKNLELAKQYRCVEDWLFLNRPELFEE